MKAKFIVTCKIEHHAILFALLAMNAIKLCGDAGETAILAGMTTYGNERGSRMRANAIANGDSISVMTSQAYGEWKPDYEGQMEFGQMQGEPTLQTYISKCAWCDSWKKHDLMKYGKLYCVNVDNAVYQGFNPDYKCTSIAANLSWGGTCCKFDWGLPLTADEAENLINKKKVLGTSCMKDFNFHTAHLLYTIGNSLRKHLNDRGDIIVRNALEEYTAKFGQEYLDALEGVYEPS